ncbi:MAG: glycosyltransferase, partial [Acidimicrobiales bacterium]
LWSSQVYAQLSWHEAFGVSVAEAMLCGCTPVVTDVPALQEVAGRWALTTTSPDDDLAAIDRAAKTDLDRDVMRADIAQRFTPGARAGIIAAAISGPSR